MVNKLFKYFHGLYKKVFNIQLVEEYEKRINSLQRDIRYLERKNKNLLDRLIITQFDESDIPNIKLETVRECRIDLRETTSDVFLMSDEEFLKANNE